jgi:DNA-binding cell septation regulator SpoVG
MDRKDNSDVVKSSAEKHPLETKPIEVRVLAIKLVLKPGAVRALVDIELVGIGVIRKLRIVQENGQEPWVAMPSERYESDNGETKYTILVQIKNEELMRRIKEEVIKAWRK